jgi:integration host factor subunit alpha
MESEAAPVPSAGPGTIAPATQTIRKTDLINALIEGTGLNRALARDVVEVVFELLQDALAAGEAVKLAGFGNFRLRDKRARMGRNPKTGAAAPIAARRIVTFQGSAILQDRVQRRAE